MLLNLVTMSGGTSSTPQSITDGITAVIEIFGKASTMIMENPIAMVFIGIALVGGGVGLFGRVRRGG